MLCLLPIPLAFAEEGGGEGVTNNYSYYYTYITGGENEQGYSDATTVNTSITNITSENTTVYVYGDYNPEYLYRPVVSEMHMRNHAAGALWDPELEELPKSLRAFIMDKAGIALLYDGYVDLERAGDNKPHGATREGEILGYDIYAKLGEAYTYVDDSNAYSYVSTGVYSDKDPVNVSWAVMQLYRAVGEELVQFYVTTESRDASDYNINSSPLVQYISMATDGVDLSKVISNVYASRTDIDTYWDRAQVDRLGIFKATDPEKQYLTVGDFCELAYKLMYIYGEPVLTDQEIALLMQAYGRDLPYGLNSIQLEAVKHLMARGILDNDLDWESNITFEDAITVLMRIKDEDSRLTFKDIQLTLDVDLLVNGYYPVEVSEQAAPIEVLGTLDVDPTTYPYYDYFIEFTPETRFKTTNGFYSIPFICKDYDNSNGVVANTSYVGTYSQAGRTFYHFVVQRSEREGSPAVRYINTSIAEDLPSRYDLGRSYNTGGYFLQNRGPYDLRDEGNNGTTLTGWTHYGLDEGPLTFPDQYVDAKRFVEATRTSTSQMSLFNESQYGISFRILSSNRGKVKVTKADGNEVSLTQISSSETELENGYTIKCMTASASDTYWTYTVEGLQSSSGLQGVLKIEENSNASYQSYPAIAKQGEQYLVPVELLKAKGVVWTFEKLGEGYYYLGVKSGIFQGSDFAYTDVFINTGESGNAPYMIKGSQMKIYEEDVALVVEQDSTYYIDYSAILGTTTVVGFELSGGAMSLTGGGLPRNERGTTLITTSQIKTTRDLASLGGRGELLSTYHTDTQIWIYCPITYALANWICTEEPSGARRLFTFWAKTEGYQGDDTAKTNLQELVGITLPDQWVCYETSVSPGNVKEKLMDLPAYPGYESAYYVKECGAFLIPIQFFSASEGNTYANFTDYGQMYNSATRTTCNRLTSIAGLIEYGTDTSQSNEDYRTKPASYYTAYDLNFNVCVPSDNGATLPIKSTYVRGTGSNPVSYYDIANVPLMNNMPRDLGLQPVAHEENSHFRINAPAGVPGLLGNPASHTTPSDAAGIKVYSGVYPGTGTMHEDTSQYAIIHSTPYCTWYQSNTFTFTMTPGGLLDSATTSERYTVTAGEAASTFDWASFFKEQKLLDADSALSVLIILVLNILPRILTAFCILLIGFATISTVKPWQSFCDNVFDPYKALTFGRKDVHTIEVKQTVFFSVLALAFFGLCQNGTIIDIIAWIARAVVGIMNR